MSFNPEVVIVGGGLAGLSAARALHAASVPFTLLEAADSVGGRVATDQVEGFLLDRGFQVLLDSYPEARRQLDFAALDLRPFAPGALVRRDGSIGRVSDPWRDPIAGARSLVSGAFTPADAWRMMRLRADAILALEGEVGGEGQTTARALQDRGFSERAMDSFFRPFFGGVFLDTQLTAPARWFEFLFGMFATGSATLPAQGMGAIPRQLASTLPPGAVRTNAKVRTLRAGRVELASGEVLSPRAVLLATDARHANVLVPGHRAPQWSSCVTLYFSATTPPIDAPILMLNGERTPGPVNHVCVPSLVSPTYAPPGQHLIAATVVGAPSGDDASLERDVRAQLTRWFGAGAVNTWYTLRITRVPFSLPKQFPSAGAAPSAVRLDDGLYACGDYLETPSINGALRSGRRAAETLLADWSGARGAVA
jgi:phytoene dehydrogenase-like protein